MCVYVCVCVCAPTFDCRLAVTDEDVSPKYSLYNGNSFIIKMSIVR